MISSQQWDLWLLALCLGWNLSVYSIILHMLRSRNFGYIKVPENLPSHLKLNTELTAAELESKCVRVLVFGGFWFLSDVKSALCTAKMITHWSQCAPVALFSPCRNIWLITPPQYHDSKANGESEKFRHDQTETFIGSEGWFTMLHWKD